MTNIGSNQFKNCLIPIAFEDRYFILEQKDDNDIFSVFTLIDDKPIFEILYNEPQDNPITDVIKSSPNFITVSSKLDGNFIYKIRLEYKGSSIFGKIKGEEKEIKITDKSIKIGGSTFSNNTVIGCAVGIIVDKNGSIGMGASLPKAVRHLFI